MTVLYLLRHGPTNASQQGAPLGRLDWPVTPEGQTLWPRVKRDLLFLGLQRVLTSDLVRARDHAQDLGLPCQELNELGEQAFGAWDGVPWSRIQGAEGFFADPVHGAPPGGETFAQCATRATRVLEALGADLAASPILVLAHGGPLRAILAHFLGLPLHRALDLAWSPFGLSRLDCYGKGQAVLQFHNQPLPRTGAPEML